jgi:hypothetical protein
LEDLDRWRRGQVGEAGMTFADASQAAAVSVLTHDEPSLDPLGVGVVVDHRAMSHRPPEHQVRILESKPSCIDLYPAACVEA